VKDLVRVDLNSHSEFVEDSSRRRLKRSGMRTRSATVAVSTLHCSVRFLSFKSSLLNLRSH